ncbi:hypothetical protein [Novosphingobium sp.]|uniref:hypothetical protein n=1 Tax=Novosphingobium sp. TaxID=1874826 RepID=UPI00260EC9E3|nr:hypothetical protein [Novosphingobium sp.]
MARLKTLKDGDETAAQDAVAGDLAPETAPEGEAIAPAEEAAPEAVSDAPAIDEASEFAVTAAQTVSTSPDTIGGAEGVSTAGQGSAVHPEPAEGLDTNGAAEPETVAIDPIAVAQAAASDALARVDDVQAEYLAQSDKLAAANAQVASLTDDLKDREARIDALTATLAQRDAQIAALGAAPPAPVAETTIKRPKVGKALKLPEEGEYAKWGDVSDLLDAGDLTVLVLADDNGVVQPYPAVIGGKALFTPQASSLLFGGMIQLEPEMDQVTLRFAVLLDAGGKVLSVCRLGALLIGGGGLSAMIPGNNLRFSFG